MPNTLIVMRHAKSSWDTLEGDAQRPLNPRGQASAAALGDWLRARDLVPDTILCSSATRTAQTAQGLQLRQPATLLDALYLASSDQIMRQVQRATGATLLVIGHNPGIGEFASRMAQDPAVAARLIDCPTGATAVFECPAPDWRSLAWRSGSLLYEITPRDLIA